MNLNDNQKKRFQMLVLHPPEFCALCCKSDSISSCCRCGFSCCANCCEQNRQHRVCPNRETVRSKFYSHVTDSHYFCNICDEQINNNVWSVVGCNNFDLCKHCFEGYLKTFPV